MSNITITVQTPLIGTSRQVEFVLNNVPKTFTSWSKKNQIDYIIHNHLFSKAKSKFLDFNRSTFFY